jgi:hypothetical protein
MIQQFASVASDHMPIMSELADIIIEAPLGHCFPSGNIRLLAFFEHVLLIDILVTLTSLLVRKCHSWLGAHPANTLSKLEAGFHGASFKYHPSFSVFN